MNNYLLVFSINIICLVKCLVIFVAVHCLYTIVCPLFCPSPLRSLLLNWHCWLDMCIITFRKIFLEQWCFINTSGGLINKHYSFKNSIILLFALYLRILLLDIAYYVCCIHIISCPLHIVEHILGLMTGLLGIFNFFGATGCLSSIRKWLHFIF